MYMRDSGLGFWTELFKIGSGFVKSALPAVASIAAQNALQKRFQGQVPIQSAAVNQTQYPPQQSYQQYPAPYPYQQAPSQIIAGVPNAILIGGVLVAVFLITRRD